MIDPALINLKNIQQLDPISIDRTRLFPLAPALGNLGRATIGDVIDFFQLAISPKTSGKILAASGPLSINWAMDVVPGEDLTYEQKHGPIDKVEIQLSVPDPLNDGYFTGSLLYRFSVTPNKILVFDNQFQDAYYLIK